MPELFRGLTSGATFGVRHVLPAARRYRFAAVATTAAAESAVGMPLDRGDSELGFTFHMGLCEIQHVGEFFHRKLTYPAARHLSMFPVDDPFMSF